MRSALDALQALARRSLVQVDRLFNRLYTWRFNPLYHSGALVVGCFVILTVTGIYLLFFYRIGSPYASVERIANQAFAGRWIRTMHRYVSDLAILAALVHALRMFAQNRTWGARTLAWVSGIGLLGVFFVCGWTGFVMVWDSQAQLLAVEGARLIDVFPIFSEPIGRAFVGERAVPSAFFFINLFAHIAIPVGILLILWIHVSRLARANVMPPKPLFWGTVLTFAALSVAWPAVLGPEADPFSTPGVVPIDLVYGFWLPVSRALPPGLSWLILILGATALVAVPWVTRPAPSVALLPSWVNPRFCTGCEQCFHDCPYEAISMVARDDDRPYTVGLVDPDKCVSCGICSGSCAPMGVGPAGRTGRDQLDGVRAFIEERRPTAETVVVIGCDRSAAGWGRTDVDGSPVLAVSCVGSLHTSVVEYLIRAGAAGVLVVSCPPRDCRNREGVVWLEERLYNQREAELKDRVDRRRLRVVYAAEGEIGVVARAVGRFSQEMRALDRALSEPRINIDTECTVPSVSVLELET